MGASYFQAIGGLILCLGLIVILASYAKKHKEKLEKFFSADLFIKPADKRMCTIERLPLGPHHSAVIVEKDGVEHFIILSPQTSLVVDGPKTPRKASQS